MSNQATERFLIFSGHWREDSGASPSQGQLDLNHVIRKELVYQGLAKWKIINGKPCCSLIEIIGGGGGVVTPTTFTSTPSSTGISLVVDGISQTLSSTTATNAGLMLPSTLTTINSLVTLTGLPSNSINLDTFTGNTITDGSTVKAALQLLETALETKQKQLTVKSANTTVGTIGQFDKFNFTGATVTANTTDPTQVDVVITPPTAILEYSAGNGTIVTATGLGVTFVRTTSSVWTFTIPIGVKLLSHDIYSTSGENPGTNVTINYNYTSNTLTNQGFSTARPPSYAAFNMQPTSGIQAITGGTGNPATAFRPTISDVSGGNITMAITTGGAISTLETLIKGIF